MSENKEQGEKSFKGAVVYIDGSCRPHNPGYIGWGSHGYLYNEINPEKLLEVEAHVPSTIGYAPMTKLHPDDPKRHPKYIQGAEPVVPEFYLDFLGSNSKMGSNNTAEVQALVYTLEFLIKNKYTVQRIEALTDSQYLVNGINDWCVNWVRYGWKKMDGSPVPNSEWWMRAWDAVCRLRGQNVTFTIRWVKSHSGIFGNVQADMLAGIGMNYSRYNKVVEQFLVSSPKGYWKHDPERHPFINFKRAYFNTVEKFNISGHYFQADGPSTTFIIGKRLPETGFAVVRLNDPDEVLESIKLKQFEVANGFNSICEMKLDNIYNKASYPYLKTHGVHSLVENRHGFSLRMIDRTPITVEMNPTGLSMRAIESFGLLGEILDTYIAMKAGDSERIKQKLIVHDITDLFYNTITKKVKGKETQVKELKAEYVNGFTDMYVPIKEEYEGKLVDLKLPYVLGTDTLPRNNLKRIESLNPSISLITWRESPTSIRYATVIECDTGTGIWSNFYADRVFLDRPQPDAS